jgi:hypothetical protein
MKMDDIRALRGEQVAVEFPRDEADVGYRYKAIVEATVIEAPIEFDAGYGSGSRKGARLRLAESLRVIRRDGFEELPAGHEFDSESRLIEGAWDKWRGGRHPNDAEGAADRRRRYEEQDAIRAAEVRLGMPPLVLKGGGVVVERDGLAAWLKRIDPTDLAADVIDAFVEEVCRRQPWTGLGDMRKTYPAELRSAKVAAIREVEDGLAVSDAELAPEEL